MEIYPCRGDHGSSEKDRCKEDRHRNLRRLIEESRIFARILKLNGFDVYGVACKVGSVDKQILVWIPNIHVRPDR